MNILTQFTLALSSLLTIQARAEVLACSGQAPTTPQTGIEVSVDMDKGTSFLRWIYPDGTRITQAQDMNRRKYSGDMLMYVGGISGSPRVYLQIPLTDYTRANGTFSHLPQGLNAVPVKCEIFGTIPRGPVCPKTPDIALLRAMDTAVEINGIEFLVACGANVNVANAKGCTPIMLAIDPECHRGNASGMISDTSALVEYFLNNGAFVNSQDVKGETALIKATKNSVQNVYDQFIASEAVFDVQDRQGNTALMYAALEGDPWIIEDILEGNPDRRLKHKARQTAFDIAQQWHGKEIADLIRIPDETVTVAGRADGTCSPLNIELRTGQAVEFALRATSKMFRLEARGLALDLMADSGATAKKIVTLVNRGTLNFTCGFHGASNVSRGVITVK